ncbi:MAG: DUF4375 domain-containing protein [Clostridia bacterium]|nr:DUF4375 domain-containing protein [Clostridia bacterium]
MGFWSIYSTKKNLDFIRNRLTGVTDNAEIICPGDLSNDTLVRAIIERLEKTVYSYNTIEDGINALNEKQRIIFVLDYMEMEINNGGLCQFFVNSSRVVAPIVSKYLEVTGAFKHKKLYDDFISQNNIDVNNLSSFDSNTHKEFSAQYERYPFDDFDNAFYELEPLETYLIPYIRENINDL